MGHRVTNHAGKCRNLHGHRYTIQVTLEGSVASRGEQDGMVVDFGFIKDLLMEKIDGPCDHGLCLWVMDSITSHILDAGYRVVADKVAKSEHGGYQTSDPVFGKLYILNRVPTAENLAYHWYCVLAESVVELSKTRARLNGVRVWETPNCFADYRPNY